MGNPLVRFCEGLGGNSAMGNCHAYSTTSNVQHRIMNSACRELLCRTVKFKKNTEQSKSTVRNSIRLSSSQATVQYSAVFRSCLQRDSLVLKSIKRSVINIDEIVKSQKSI